eukprot:scaffold1444_cov134-Isochrysis_galbana.AAC.10
MSGRCHSPQRGAPCAGMPGSRRLAEPFVTTSAAGPSLPIFCDGFTLHLRQALPGHLQASRPRCLRGALRLPVVHLERGQVERPHVADREDVGCHLEDRAVRHEGLVVAGGHALQHLRMVNVAMAVCMFCSARSWRSGMGARKGMLFLNGKYQLRKASNNVSRALIRVCARDPKRSRMMRRCAPGRPQFPSPISVGTWARPGAGAGAGAGAAAAPEPFAATAAAAYD